MPLGSQTYSSLTFSKHNIISALSKAFMNITSLTAPNTFGTFEFGKYIVAHYEVKSNMLLPQQTIRLLGQEPKVTYLTDFRRIYGVRANTLLCCGQFLTSCIVDLCK